MAAENFAILYSGGGDARNNHDRYYTSLKKTYEALRGRGVPEKNIVISHASGVGANGISPALDQNMGLMLQEIEEGKSDLLSDESYRLMRKFFGLLNSKNSGYEEDKGKMYVNFGFGNATLSPFVNELNKTLFLLDEKILLFSLERSESDPSRAILKLNLIGKSDFGFAKQGGSEVVAGTPNGLQVAIDEISDRIDSDDSLFVWTFDHGGIDLPEERQIGEGTYNDQGENLANLVTWPYSNESKSKNIPAAQFVDMFDDLVGQTGSTTFALAQCFAGGLLAGLLDDEDLKESKSWFGLAATNQREVSWGSFFADEVSNALKNPSVQTALDLWNAVSSSESYIAKSSSSYKANQGVYEEGIWVPGLVKPFEHPWSTYEVNGNNVNLFANEGSRTPWEKAGIQFNYDDSWVGGAADLSFTIAINEDSSFDVVEALRQEFGGFDYFNIFAVNSPKYGSFEIPSSAQAQVFNYIPQADFYGEDQFRVSASFDGGFVADIDVSVEVVSVNDAPLAVDDEFFVPVGAKDFLIDIDDAPGFLDDTDLEGDALTIVDYSQAEHGVIEKVGDELFRYTPDSGFEGVDSFLYVTSDGEDSSVAEVFLGVGTDLSNLRRTNTLTNTISNIIL